MKFEEKDSITIRKYKKVFIYFLLKENEVVYVGKTTQGISRPLSHKNKDFDTINIIYCNEREIDRLENYYILKYSPKYNRVLNYNSSYSLDMAVKQIKEKINPDFNMWKLKSIIKKMNLKVQEFNKGKFISKADFEKIIAQVGGNHGE